VVRGGKRRVCYTGKDDQVLRSALWSVWGKKCYWCHSPVEFDVTQIDHIIPRSVSVAVLRRFKTELGLPEDFDLDDPQNLAPICTPCNGAGVKGSRAVVTPKVGSMLGWAAKRRDAVVTRAQSFGRSGKLAEHLLEVTLADFTDDGIREEFAKRAPALMQVLARTDSKLLDYPSFELVEVPIDWQLSYYQTVDATLDSRGRMATALLEEICDCGLDGALQGPVVQLFGGVHERVKNEFELIASDDPITAGDPEGDFVTLSLDSIDYRRADDSIEFTFRGNFTASLTASLTRSDSRGDELEELQGDAVVRGTFSSVVYWTFDGFEAGDFFIGDWDADLQPEDASLVG
jgi:hypothetical protein